MLSSGELEENCEILSENFSQYLGFNLCTLELTSKTTSTNVSILVCGVEICL